MKRPTKSFLLSVLLVGILLTLSTVIERKSIVQKIELINNTGAIIETSLKSLAQQPVLVFSPNCNICQRFIKQISEDSTKHYSNLQWVSLGTFSTTKKMLTQTLPDVRWYVVINGRSVFSRIPNPLPYIIQMNQQGSLDVMTVDSISRQ